MRARITQTEHNECTLEHLDPWTDEPTTRNFWAPSTGGYVREVSERRPGRAGSQVCDGLAGSGHTLYWGGSRPLVDLIRREWRIYRRDARRAA